MRLWLRKILFNFVLLGVGTNDLNAATSVIPSRNNSCPPSVIREIDDLLGLGRAPGGPATRTPQSILGISNHPELQKFESGVLENFTDKLSDFDRSHPGTSSRVKTLLQGKSPEEQAKILAVLTNGTVDGDIETLNGTLNRLKRARSGSPTELAKVDIELQESIAKLDDSIRTLEQWLLEREYGPGLEGQELLVAMKDKVIRSGRSGGSLSPEELDVLKRIEQRNGVKVKATAPTSADTALIDEIFRQGSLRGRQSVEKEFNLIWDKVEITKIRSSDIVNQEIKTRPNGVPHLGTDAVQIEATTKNKIDVCRGVNWGEGLVGWFFIRCSEGLYPTSESLTRTYATPQNADHRTIFRYEVPVGTPIKFDFTGPVYSWDRGPGGVGGAIEILIDPKLFNAGKVTGAVHTVAGVGPISREATTLQSLAREATPSRLKSTEVKLSSLESRARENIKAGGLPSTYDEVKRKYPEYFDVKVVQQEVRDRARALASGRTGVADPNLRKVFKEIDSIQALQQNPTPFWATTPQGRAIISRVDTYYQTASTALAQAKSRYELLFKPGAVSSIEEKQLLLDQIFELEIRERDLSSLKNYVDYAKVPRRRP